MQPSANGLKLIQVFEKLRLTPYLDSAHIWTVGWGHALTTPAGQPIDADIFGAARAQQLAREAMQRMFGAWTIKPEQADELLAKDVAARAESLTRYLAPDTTQMQFDGLFSFDFNVGLGNFAGSSLRRLHNSGKRAVGAVSVHDLNDKAKAHATATTVSIAFVDWCNANGHYLLGLFRRRVAELLVYSGWNAQKAFDLVEQFNG